MGLGTCRFCGAERIATDAPICRECGGWRPNPGFCTRTNIFTTRLVALLMLVGGLGASVWANWNLAVLVYAFPFVVGGGTVLLRSLIRPYGREVSDQ